MKRIAIVLPSMACAGAEVLMAAHAMALADLGHKVAIVCFQKHYPSWANFPNKEKLLSTIEFVELDCSIKFRFLRQPVFNNQAWIDFMDGFKPDIVHSNLYLSELLVHSHVKNGVKYISHGHDNMPQLRRLDLKTLFNKTLLTNWWERRWLMRQYQKSYTHFIAISEDVETYLKENFPALRGRITRVPNAIDRKRFWVQRDYTTPKPIFKMLSVGSLVPKKNHEYLIGVAKMLKSKGFAFEINVLGEGPLKDELIRKTEEAGCADILFFRGSVPDVPSWMAESDLYVHPANYEPFGLVLIEAMTSGMPVVSLDGRGNRGLVENGVNGFFLPVDTSQEAFVNRVEEFMLDREKLIKMGDAAQVFSEAFDIQAYSKRLLQVYTV
ncbi:MAG: glycosyltransferase family 4 protein [Bacteroidia bacterium]